MADVIDQDLKVIVDYLVNQGLEDGKKAIILEVPDDYKEVLYKDKDNVAAYVSSLGYTAQVSGPNSNSWRGWDVPLSRADEFPEGFTLGKSHNNYQLMEVSPNNLRIRVVF